MTCRLPAGKGVGRPRALVGWAESTRARALFEAGRRDDALAACDSANRLLDESRDVSEWVLHGLATARLKATRGRIAALDPARRESPTPSSSRPSTDTKS